MILPLSDILQQLEAFDPVILKKTDNALDGREGTERSFVSLSGIRLFQPAGQAHLPDFMYVCFASRMNGFCRHRGAFGHLLVIEDEALADKEQLCRCVSDTVIVLRRADTDLGEVFRHLQMLTRYVCDSSLIMEQMLDTLQKTPGLTHVTSLFARMMGNRVIILDTGFRVLAWGLPEVAQDGGGEGRKGKKSVPGEAPKETDYEIIAKYFRDSGRLKRISERYGPVFYGWKESMELNERSGEIFSETVVYGCIDCMISINGVPVGYMTLEGTCQPVTAEDVSMVSIFSRLVALELQKDRFYEQNSSQQYSSLLKDMLAGTISEREEIQRRLSVLGYRLPEEMRMIVIGQEQESDKAPYLLQSEGAQAELRSYFQDSMSVFLDDRLILLAAAEELSGLDGSGPGEAFSVSREFEERLEREQLLAGFSSPFRDIREISLYYRQAAAAFDSGVRRRIGMRDRQEEWEHSRIIRYYECGFEHLLEAGRRSAEIRAEDLCLPQICQMHQSADENTRELLRTLRVYMYHHEDTDRTAEELCIHRNTLYYRLGRLRKIFGEHFTQGETAFRILMSLKILNAG